MWTREPERRTHLNWTAIFSLTASLAFSLAIWRGLFRAVEHLMKLGTAGQEVLPVP